MASRKQLDEWQRRTLLKTLGPAGLGVMAGCIGDGDPGDIDTDIGDDDDDTRVPGDDDDDDEQVPLEELVDPREYVVENQSLRLTGSLDPSMTKTLSWDSYFDPERTTDWNLLHGTNEMTIWNLWGISALWDEPGPTRPCLYESVEIDEQFIKVKIEDEARFHDGEPVTARDAMITLGMFGYMPNAPGSFYYGSMLYNTEVPDGLDGKVIEYEVLPTWLDESDGWLHHQPGFISRFHLAPEARHGGVRHGVATHKWPYDELAERTWEMQQAKYDVIQEHPELWNDPDYIREFREEDEEGNTPFVSWWRENMPEEMVHTEYGLEGRPRMNVLFDEVVGDEDTYDELAEQSTDPDWYVGHGLYELDEVVGTEEYRLVPNENHRLYDEHTFDEVIIEWTPEDHRTRAGLMAERLDHASLTLSPELTAALPDQYEQVNYPQTHGYTLALNHAYWVGASPFVRQALMYATDRHAIAQNIHPETAAPILTPGWHHWGAAQFIDADWAEEHLTSYEYDLEVAEEHMELAGFERIDDHWHDPDGEPIEDHIHTTASEPIFEETVAHQWREFGIDIETFVHEPASFQERWEGSEEPDVPGMGNFAVSNVGWPSSGHAGWFSNLPYRGTKNWIHNVRARNWYGVEATEEIAAKEYRDDGYGTDRGWDRMTIDLPPAGEPSSDERVPYAMHWAMERCQRDVYDWTGDNQPIAEGRYEPDQMNVDNVRQAMAWTLNWFLYDLPMVRNSGQAFINSENFNWGQSIPQVDGIQTQVDDAHEMWEFFGSLSGPHYYPSNNWVWADPANPKIGGEVRRT